MQKSGRKPLPPPPHGGGQIVLRGHWVYMLPPQGGAGGGASLLARPLVACKARTPNARFLHQCQQKCVIFAADMLRGIPREGRRNESPPEGATEDDGEHQSPKQGHRPREGRRNESPRRGRRITGRGIAPVKADGMKAPGGGDGLFYPLMGV